MVRSSEKLIIFDTTLRDGEQSPGASMTQEEKVRIARTLEKMRVDVIEAGFAVASPGDFAAVQAVAENIQDSRICSLSRAIPKDIETAAAAIKPARAGRIHTFIATSPVHMQYKLAMQPHQVYDMAIQAVRLARNLCEDVEFSCEDAGRSEFDFLCRIIEAVIKAGARTINIPDTVGYAIPEQFGALMTRLLQRICNITCKFHDMLFRLACYLLHCLLQDMPYLDLASHVRLRSTSVCDDDGEDDGDSSMFDRSSLVSDTSRQSVDSVR